MKRSQLKRKVGRLKRRSRLKPVSKKRAAKNREVKEFRMDLKNEVGACELCGQSNVLLDCHEIARGGARVKALSCRFAILVLCRGCHEVTNDEPALWTVARQLALLRLRRPQDFNLDGINALLTRKVCVNEVDKAGEILVHGSERRGRRTA